MHTKPFLPSVSKRFPSNRTTINALACLLLSLSYPLSATEGFDPDRHMRVDDVRPGMRGYGMTVFSGVKPEPFNVEVVSVQYQFKPNKSVVWIRCPDPRMQKSGPVAGMSGSPIYLWPESAKHPDKQFQIGKGGKMIGAFAFGFQAPKDCYVGVQPIEQMYETASRINDATRASASAAPATAVRSLLNYAASTDLPTDSRWRVDAVARLLNVPTDPTPDSNRRPINDIDQAFMTPELHRMMIPLNLGSHSVTRACSPMLQAMGFLATGSGGAISSQPPKWLDPDSVKFEPGGVVSIPMVSGPLDLSAVGTVTDVTKDGRVLAFGHSFFSQGAIRVPLATGYVHFIQPGVTRSFKLGGTLKVHGALLRDESAAVVGQVGESFESFPLDVTLKRSDEDWSKRYNYRVASHPRLSPSLVAAATGNSVTADAEPPRDSTIQLSADFKFTNGRSIRMDRTIPSGNAERVTFDMLTPIVAATSNPFADAMIESAKVVMDVQPGVYEAHVIGGSLSPSVAIPGETLTMQIKLLPYRGSPEYHTMKLTLPDDVPPGTLTVSIGGAASHNQRVLSSKPFLGTADTSDEYFDALNFIVGQPSTGLFASVTLPARSSVSIGRRELTKLPGSRRSVLVQSGSSYVKSVPDMLTTNAALPYVVKGLQTFSVKIIDPLK